MYMNGYGGPPYWMAPPTTKEDNPIRDWIETQKMWMAFIEEQENKKKDHKPKEDKKHHTFLGLTQRELLWWAFFVSPLGMGLSYVQLLMIKTFMKSVGII